MRQTSRLRSLIGKQAVFEEDDHPQLGMIYRLKDRRGTIFSTEEWRLAHQVIAEAAAKKKPAKKEKTHR